MRYGTFDGNAFDDDTFDTDIFETITAPARHGAAKPIPQMPGHRTQPRLHMGGRAVPTNIWTPITNPTTPWTPLDDDGF
jgi:hypothetical protein